MVARNTVEVLKWLRWHLWGYSFTPIWQSSKLNFLSLPKFTYQYFYWNHRCELQALLWGECCVCVFVGDHINLYGLLCNLQCSQWRKAGFHLLGFANPNFVTGSLAALVSQMSMENKIENVCKVVRHFEHVVSPMKRCNLGHVCFSVFHHEYDLLSSVILSSVRWIIIIIHGLMLLRQWKASCWGEKACVALAFCLNLSVMHQPWCILFLFWINWLQVAPCIWCH